MAQSKQPPKGCPVCLVSLNSGSNQFKFIENYRRDGEEWVLYECSNCTVRFWVPFDGSKADYQIEHACERNHFFLPWNYREFFHSFEDKPGKLLDIGCGAGEFLLLCKDRGYEPHGLEINESLARIVRDKGVDCFYGYLGDFVKKEKKESFDCVTFFEVLEHLAEPKQFLKDVYSILKPRGAAVLSVPFRERSEIFKMIDYPPGHLTRWNSSSLEYIARNAGFEVELVRIRPISLQCVSGQFFQSGKLRGLGLAPKFVAACFLGLLFWLPLKFSGGKGNRIFVIARKR